MTTASSSGTEEAPLKILVATDNHLGAHEREPNNRYDDAFNTFEEILQLAIKHDVDLLLLGGDLFHDNKPSRNTMFRTMKLLRKYCLGNRPCQLSLLNDTSNHSNDSKNSNNFQNLFVDADGPNYEDPNINVSLPIFIVHGNHDDPTGDDNLACLDLLAVNGLVNYFGKGKPVITRDFVPQLEEEKEMVAAAAAKSGRKKVVTKAGNEEMLRKLMRPTVSPVQADEQEDEEDEEDEPVKAFKSKAGALHHDEVRIDPILIQKGTSCKLALYGIGNIRDERLNRLFKHDKVKWSRPTNANDKDNSSSVNEPDDSFFNLFVIHQNHQPRGSNTNYIPESMLPDFLDLVIWGHEHDSFITPIKNEITGFYVVQPGSTVATSLSPGEARMKHAALLTIFPKKQHSNSLSREEEEEVEGEDYEWLEIPLKTVRPFIFEEIDLSKALPLSSSNIHDDAIIGPSAASVLFPAIKVEAFLKDRVRTLIEQARNEWISRQGIDPKDARLQQAAEQVKPLIRLKVWYNPLEYDVCNPQRFGMFFSDQVANSRDLVVFSRKKGAIVRKDGSSRNRQQQLLMAGDEGGEDEDNSNLKLEDIISDLLGSGLNNTEGNLETNSASMIVLAENDLNEALYQFVEKDERDSLLKLVNSTIVKRQRQLIDLKVPHNLELIKQELLRNGNTSSSKSSRRRRNNNNDDDDDDDDGEDEDEAFKEIGSSSDSGGLDATGIIANVAEHEGEKVKKEEDEDVFMIIDDSDDNNNIVSKKATARKPAGTVQKKLNLQSQGSGSSSQGRGKGKKVDVDDSKSENDGKTSTNGKKASAKSTSSGGISSRLAQSRKKK